MDERPRYHVATISGDLAPRTGKLPQCPNLSAHVIDRPHACKVVATFRSEEPLRRKHWRDRPGTGRRLGNARAIAAAEALAAEWNAEEARL